MAICIESYPFPILRVICFHHISQVQKHLHFCLVSYKFTFIQFLSQFYSFLVLSLNLICLVILWYPIDAVPVVKSASW